MAITKFKNGRNYSRISAMKDKWVIEYCVLVSNEYPEWYIEAILDNGLEEPLEVKIHKLGKISRNPYVQYLQYRLFNISTNEAIPGEVLCL